MSYQIFLTRDAVKDLEELDEYLSASESADTADYVLGKIGAAIQRLRESPERGTRPKELQALGVSEYRQVYFKPYRMIYTVRGTNVYVLLIADGRRDMESLLQRRLLGG
jgi:toxin ParE1/3/4